MCSIPFGESAWWWQWNDFAWHLIWNVADWWVIIWISWEGRSHNMLKCGSSYSKCIVKRYTIDLVAWLLHLDDLFLGVQLHCRDVCKIALWSAEYVINNSITKFHWISNSIEISLVGRAPGVRHITASCCWANTQYNCRDVFIISLWSVEHILNQGDPNFDRISNSIEILLVGRVPRRLNNCGAQRVVSMI